MERTKLPTEEEIAAMTSPYEIGVALGQRLGYAQARCDLHWVTAPVALFFLLLGTLIGSLLTELMYQVLH